jgi:hypothetical protein
MILLSAKNPEALKTALRKTKSNREFVKAEGADAASLRREEGATEPRSVIVLVFFARAFWIWSRPTQHRPHGKAKHL